MCLYYSERQWFKCNVKDGFHKLFIVIGLHAVSALRNARAFMTEVDYK